MKEKILIVDDAPFMRMMLKDILTKNGYEVVEAADGNDGIEKFKAEQPALVIMDISMPKMDGIDATKEIKKIDSDAKIIMLSALSKEPFVIQSIRAGAVDFIVKPFQADFFVGIVTKHLNKNIELNIDEDEISEIIDSKPYDVVRKVVFDAANLQKKLIEILKECINESSGVVYDELAARLVASTNEYLNPVRVPLGDKFSQDDINELLVRFTKG